MPTIRIDKNPKDRCYFVTFTVIDMIDIFTTTPYFEVIINTLKFYQKKLNLRIFGYVIMQNHLHLLCQCRDMIAFIRGFKSYTTNKVWELLGQDTRVYIKELLKKTHSRKKGTKRQIWKSGNWPKIVEDDDYFEQKLNYIHENPVVKGYVDKEEDWLYSSARNHYKGDRSIIEVDIEGILD